MKECLTNTVSLQELQYMRDQEHLTNAEIAKKLDVSAATIAKYIGKSPFRKRRSSYSAADIKTIQEMYRNGATYDMIQEAVSCSSNTVRRYTKGIRRKQPAAAPAAPVTVTAPAAASAPAVTSAPVIVSTPVVERMQSNMFKVISSRRNVRLGGSEYQYEVDLGGGRDTVTVINGSVDMAIFDAESLDRFIDELRQIREGYLTA